MAWRRVASREMESGGQGQVKSIWARLKKLQSRESGVRILGEDVGFY